MKKTININEWDKLTPKQKKAVTKINFTGTKKVSDTTDRPTMGFATMCKDEEHCIGTTLNCAKPYVDYVVVADNGSTDKTFDVVREFFEESGLPGSWHIDSWEGYAINKTKMMSYIKDKTEYLLHLDADDFLQGDFYFTHSDIGYDYYSMEMRRGTSTWKATVIYDNSLTWRFVGTAHTIVKANEKPESMSKGDLSLRGYCDCDGIGSRAFDPKKFWYDGERLTKQFFDCLITDPDNILTRSAFYAAQSYMDYGEDGCIEKGLQWYRIFMLFPDTWIEERFEAQLRIARCLMILDNHKENFNQIKFELDKAIEIFDDRAEPYFIMGRYCCENEIHEFAYDYLKYEELNLKPFFSLHPPRKGINSKKHFGVKKGVLGDNKEQINDLIKRML
jgi:glycosyltransferase involved in cell wall biosynthesis